MKTTTSSCEAALCVKRNRVKNFNGTVYFKDSQEFEIELFNPTQSTKLAKIKINGEHISNSGIVLKPGQRVYLERYLDTPKKFLFQTYNVEDSKESLKAIEKNGCVNIEFYDQYVPSTFPLFNTFDLLMYKPNPVYCGSNNILLNASNKINIGSLNPTFSAGSSNTLSINTGRVEAGEKSSQSFEAFNGSFNSWVTSEVKIKILPISIKPFENTDLALYCTECGSKNKKNWKFCPKCGTKY